MTGMRENKSKKIDLHGDISIPYLKKSRFTGSFRGMRYLLEKAERTIEEAQGEEPAKTENVICAVIWPEPFNDHSRRKKAQPGFSVYDGGNLGGGCVA